MNIWTRGSSPRSGSRSSWTRIKNVNGASRLSNFWIFFGAIQTTSCCNWWPWTKPGYNTMTRRQSNNQWSGEIAAHPAQNFRVQKSASKVLASIFWDEDGILFLTDYLPKGQTINAEYYSSLRMKLKDILKKNAAGKSPRVSCSYTTMPRLTGHL